MNFAMVVFLFSLMVPTEPFTFGAGPFETMAECEAAKAGVVDFIKNHNASDNPVKVHYFAAECVPLTLAPKGKDA